MPTALRQTIRSLARAPLFTAAAVLTLGLGIGASSAAFTVVDDVLLRPLPYPDAGRLVVLRHSLIGLGIPDAGQSLGTFYFYRHNSHTLAAVAAYSPAPVNLAGPAGGDADAERVNGASISANLLGTLGVAPARGRGFISADEAPNVRVAIISDALWHRRFGGDARILDTQTRIDGSDYRIVGVMPPGFHYPGAATDLWRPLQLDSLTPHAGSFSYAGIARLAPGATAASAQAELNKLLPRLPESFPDLFPELPTARLLLQAKAAAVVQPMRDAVIGSFARALWVVAATVVLLLAVTCANVANLLLVRAQGVAHELAVRAALGASRARLMGRFFTESGVLAAAGAVVGVGLAFAATGLLVRNGPANFPRLASVHVDVITIAFTILVALLVTAACGVLPALRLESASLTTFLREGGRSATGGRARHRAQRALIVVQVALALVLLAGSGLLARTVQRLGDVQPGFDPASTLSFTLSLPAAQYPHAGDIGRFYEDVLNRISALPGVVDAGIVSKLPLSGPDPLAPIKVERAPAAPNTLPPVFPFPMASAGYFRAMHIALVAGRLFTEPTDPNGANDAIVSRAFAEQYWHDSTGRAAIGERIQVFSNRWSTIVGVVESVRDTSLEAAPIGQVYAPFSLVSSSVPDSLAPFTPRVESVVLRTRGDPASLGSSVRREIRAIDPTVPVYDLESLTAVVDRATARTRFVLMTLGSAAAIALVVGAVGLYGVIAYVVTLRTRELGLRLALGAAPGGVLGLVLREGVVLGVAGVAAGLVAFAAIAHFLRGLLFGVGPTDPLTLAVVAGTLVAVAGLASVVPAWRASRIDPLEALRGE
ncbi:MAG TPA: ABC transporter permease [Gemmatimonadaceae bacterium]|nr:ABC transporter permease [Gemmatimonadaceae bacterium]